jgi:group I intron endonuclease
VALARSLYGCAAVGLAIGVDGQIADAEIIALDGIRNIAHDTVMQDATVKHEFPGIYQILNLANGKRYVGQAQNIASRIRDHRRTRNGTPGHNPYSLLYRAVRKYGWHSFEWSVLERVDAVAELNRRETFWITALQCCDRARGYNLCPEAGVTRGWHHSDETRARLRASASQRTGAHNSFFGKHHTKATKEIIALANSAATRPRSEEERARLAVMGGRPCRPVAQIDAMTGETVRIWPSLSEAAQGCQVSIGSLIGCCKGRRGRKTVGGWRWSYADAAST